MLRCKQVTTIVASDEAADAGPWLRFRIRLHLMMCRHCARYAAQIRAIGAKARERYQRQDEQAKVEDLGNRILEAADRSKSESDPS